MSSYFGTTASSQILAILTVAKIDTGQKPI